MKEIARRRITVTSSFKEISTDQLENRAMVVQQASEQIFKDDGNNFPSTGGITPRSPS
jgi:hypothetical protein